MRPKREPADGASHQVRIVGGTLRGRTLSYPANQGTRPMKDRTREAVFSLIGSTIEHSIAIDLFAGTGALVLESLSRGAAAGIAIEQHFPTAETLRIHAKALGLEGVLSVIAGNAFVWGPRLDARRDIPWVVFCAPPYALYTERRQELLDLLGMLIDSAAEGSVFIVESDLEFDPLSLPRGGSWELRSYPPARIALLRV